MRFLSEDGKLFNTEEECKEHEESLKKQKEKEAEELKRAEQAKDLKKVMDQLEEVNKKMDELNEAIERYEKKYKVSFEMKPSFKGVNSFKNNKEKSVNNRHNDTDQSYNSLNDLLRDIMKSWE